MTVKLGQHRPMRVRRIGARHVLVLPAQQAQLLSLDDLERTLDKAREQERILHDQLARHRALLADLETQVAAFAALDIERDPDDPYVPQPQPKPRPQPLPHPRPEPQPAPAPGALPELEGDATPRDPPIRPVTSSRPRALHLPIVKA